MQPVGIIGASSLVLKTHWVGKGSNRRPKYSDDEEELKNCLIYSFCYILLKHMYDVMCDKWK